MILPAEVAVREPDSSGYADLAPIYLARGWSSVLPLPAGKKSPPPKGFTGGGAKLPTADKVEAWRATRSNGNTALYLADGLLCVDIDNYAKRDRAAGRALEVIAEVEGRAGARFPATWVLRNRSDGSEKRLYRVPTGLSWRSNLGAGVELVHSGHRYVNVGTNPDTGNPERWHDPDGLLADPPRPDQLTMLPPELVHELIRDANGVAVQGLATEVAGRRLLTELPTGVMDVSVRDLMARALDDLDGRNGSRHDATLNHVRDLVRYGAAGLAGTDIARKTLRADFVAAVADEPGRDADGEFDRMEVNAAQKAAATPGEALALFGSALKALAPGGIWHRDGLWPAGAEGDGYKVFKVLGPSEWALPVPAVEYLVTGVLCDDTFGVNAGPKKSLKTHDNQALGLAVATGKNLYLCDQFPVRQAGQVLYIVGEGGEVPVRRTLHRMAKAYGLDVADIAGDPEFPLASAFGAAPIDSDEFRDDLKRLLDTYQPVLVLIESFYNFHPSGVETGNLYERGRIIDDYHKFVRTECAGATSLLTDHYRSTGTSGALDLDNIAMSGQAENADSWILRKHRKSPDVPAGFFQLRVGFNSRQWGGTEWDIDWNLGKFDHENGCHIGNISWDVRSAMGVAGGGDSKQDLMVEQMLQVVRDNEFGLTQSQIIKEVGGNKQTGTTVFKGLLANGFLKTESRKRDENGKSQTRDFVGLGAPARARSVPAAGTDQETGSR